jgi:formate hydrogenlyase regulatory protein HycA
MENAMAAPEKLRIPYEDWEDARFEYVGQYGGGNQFMAFVTGAFPGPDHFPNPGGNWREIKRWSAVVHRFDRDGNHLGTEARLGGFDIEGRAAAGEKAWHHLGQILKDLGVENARPCDIHVKPFSAEVDGVVYALEYEREVTDDGEVLEHVMLWPNDIMFHPPWDGGKYST